MKNKSQDLATTAWKTQIDAWWRALEAIEEGARKMHEIQLEAAVEAHASTEASRKQLAEAADAQALWRIQTEWMSRNLADAQAYWRRLAETARETQTAVSASLGTQLPAIAALPAGGEGNLLETMDKAYRQWLDTTRQLYAAPFAAPENRA